MTNKQLAKAIKDGAVPISKTAQILLDSDRIVGIREGETVFDLPRPDTETGVRRIVKQMAERLPNGYASPETEKCKGIVFRPETRPYTKAGEQRFRIPISRDHPKLSAYLSYRGPFYDAPKGYAPPKSPNGDPVVDPQYCDPHPIGYWSRKPAKQLSPVQPRPVVAPDGYQPAQVVYNGVSGDSQTGEFTYTGKKPKKGTPILLDGESYTNDWLHETLWLLKGEALHIFVSGCGAEPTPADQRFYQTRSYNSETLNQIHPTERYVLICCKRNNGRYRSVLTPKAIYDANQ